MFQQKRGFAKSLLSRTQRYNDSVQFARSASGQKILEVCPPDLKNMAGRLSQNKAKIRYSYDVGEVTATIDARIEEVAAASACATSGSSARSTAFSAASAYEGPPDEAPAREPGDPAARRAGRTTSTPSTSSGSRTYLTNYENAFIVISHDVPFNAVTNVIWYVDNLKLTRYTGSYEKFEEMAA